MGTHTKNMAEAAKLAEDIKSMIKVDLPQGNQLQYGTKCCCCIQSFFIEYPQCCGVMSKGTCLCTKGTTAFQCMQFVDDAKAIKAEMGYSRCIDGRAEDGMICSEAAQQMICCWCIKGAMENMMVCPLCGCEEKAEPGWKPIFCMSQEMCCDYRCALPPGEETVPFGIACCGFGITGDPGL